MADHLRALLRDVVCGHLDPDLVGSPTSCCWRRRGSAGAGGAGAGGARRSEAQAQQALAQEAQAHAGAQESVEEILGDASQSQEILDVFI